MITESEAKKKLIEKKGRQPYSCANMKDFFVFCMEPNGSVFYAVDKKEGRVLPFSPGLDLIGYNLAPKHVYK